MKVYQSINLITVTIAICVILAACSSKTTITDIETGIEAQYSYQIIANYTESEIERIPLPAFRKIFVPGILVMVKTKNTEVLMRVTHYEDNEYITGLVEDKKNEMKILFSELKEIGIVKIKEPWPKSSISIKDELLGLYIFALGSPMLVTAPIVFPMLNVMEARNHKEAGNHKEAVNPKVNFIYQGITKDELVTYVGEPREIYLCGENEIDKEIWVFSSEQVLKGAELMLFSPGVQTVFHCLGGITVLSTNCPHVLFSFATEKEKSDVQQKLDKIYEERLGVDEYRRRGVAGNRWLGKKYEEGLNVPQNYMEAIKFYTMAAKKGDVYSQRKLGLCYIKTNKEYIKAYAWLTMATEQGSKLAIREREEISKKMTPEQIAAANELIKEIRSK